METFNDILTRLWAAEPQQYDPNDVDDLLNALGDLQTSLLNREPVRWGSMLIARII